MLSSFYVDFIGGFIAHFTYLVFRKSDSTSVLAWRNAHLVFKLPHKVDVVFVSALVCNACNTVVRAREQKLRPFDSRCYYVGCALTFSSHTEKLRYD